MGTEKTAVALLGVGLLASIKYFVLLRRMKSKRRDHRTVSGQERTELLQAGVVVAVFGLAGFIVLGIWVRSHL